MVTELANVVVAGALDEEGGSAVIAMFADRTGSVLWRREIPNETGSRYNAILDVELAQDGDLVVAGPLGDFPVRKFSPVGEELWRGAVPVDVFGGGIKLDGAGDVLVHGWDGYGTRYPVRDMLVAKLDGATGLACWTHLAQEVGSSTATQVSFDSNGDVIVAGSMHDETVACPSFSVLKRSGLDGAEQWRRVIPGPVACGGHASLVAVDAFGDVIAAGNVANSYTDLFVVKVAGDDGSELWRYHVSQSVPGSQGAALGLALTPDGDAVISGRIRPDFSIGDSLRVVRLRGTDGSPVWTRDLRGSDPTGFNTQTYPGESLIAIGLSGEIFVGDSFANVDTDRDLAVVRLDGDTGAEDWRFTWDGGGWGGETARGVAVDDRGDLFVIGYTHSTAYGRGFSVFKLDGDSGADFTEAHYDLDNCPGVSNPGQEDADADAVGDACDNCTSTHNPRISPLPFQTTTGGQLDDDADGRGNLCDADFNNAGTTVDSTDFALFKHAYGRRRASGTCGADGTRPCDVFDLDGASAVIDSRDFAGFKALFGTSARGNAPLECEGDACP